MVLFSILLIQYGFIFSSYGLGCSSSANEAVDILGKTGDRDKDTAWDCTSGRYDYLPVASYEIVQLPASLARCSWISSGLCSPRWWNSRRECDGNGCCKTDKLHYWKLLGQVSVEYLMKIYLPAIPFDVQMLFEKDTS